MTFFVMLIIIIPWFFCVCLGELVCFVHCGYIWLIINPEAKKRKPTEYHRTAYIYYGLQNIEANINKKNC